MKGQGIVRWTPLTGVVFVVLAVVAFAVGGESPDATDSTQEVVSFYTDNDSSQIWAGALLAWGTLFFVFFAAHVRALLRRGEETGILSAASFAGAIILSLGALAFASFTFTLGDVAGDLDPAAMQALSALNSDFFFPVAVGTAAFLIATGLASVRHGSLPGWLGWAAIVIGVVALTPAGFFAFLAMMLWVLVTSIVLFRAGSPAAPAAPAAPGPPA
jgi:hypothetical protein